MKKNIWILNHYAGCMLFDKGGRHYWLAKYLKRLGYDPVVFACNEMHNFDNQFVKSNTLWTMKVAEEIDTPFVFVRSSSYKKNGIDRIINMFGFYRNVQKAVKQYAKEHCKPDVILASSVHPLTLLAGQKLAKHFGVKCICEVRDLWPESLVAYGHLKRNSIIAKILYAFEKKLYVKADQVIMTWPGGYDYITEKGWETDIPEEKVTHISNGVDLEEFRKNIESHPYSDSEIENPGIKKIVYTGSVRKVNNLAMIVEAAEILNKRNLKGYKFLVYGDGTEREKLSGYVERENLTNIVFMGRVRKENVPAVLDKAYVTVLHNSSTGLDKYGQSQNKFFEYLAAGKPILMTYSVGHSICKENACGFEIENQSAESIADAIEMIVNLSDEEYRQYSLNAAQTAEKYDFRYLTQKLADVIENI